MNKTPNIFLLAAGLGERLRPITNIIPKPLIPVLGRPVLGRVLDNVSTLPLNKIGINLHHKKEDIENWIAQSAFHKKIELFPEDPILGTGGALKNAEKFLNSRTFLVHNSDILSNIDLEKLLEHHRSSGNLVTLAVHNFPKFNSLVIDKNGFLEGIKNGQGLAFTGIAVYEPEFLEFLPAEESSVVEAWLKAASDSRRIGTLDVSGCYWKDIGTPPAYASAVFDALMSDGETAYIHPSTKGCGDIGLGRNTVIEKGCVFDKSSSFKNCIVLPETSPESADYENCILGPGFKVDFDKAEIPGLPEKDGRQLIGTGGSDRKYYRVNRGDGSAVLMQCGKNDPDFERHIEYSRFFLKYSVPVPELIETGSGKMQAVFEDAGDITLYTWLKCLRSEAGIEDIYRQVINVMVTIHTRATEYVAECPLLENRVFDYEYFRWETDYFVERFVQGIRNIKTGDTAALKKELHTLASEADSFPKTIIHRDFQSQNIMVMKNNELRIIDYQGARIGPPAYDAASVLWDPYCRLKDNMREKLVGHYIRLMKDKTEERFNEALFRGSLPVCRLQRHMQALGAYGFLSAAKDKKYFLKYIPEGLRLLNEDISILKDKYPEIYSLVTSL